MAAKRLIISIQPEMSIRLQVQAKRPGLDMILNPVDLIFDYSGTYKGQTPEAYETLLLDVMLGDQTLFYAGRPGGSGLGPAHADPECLGWQEESELSELHGRFVGSRSC